MANDWDDIFLSDIYEISSGLSKPASEFGSGYPFLSFTDIFYNYFVPNQLSGLVNSNEKEQEKCSVLRGDVFLTRTSETMHELGMSAVALKNYEKATFNGFSKRLRPKENNTLHPEYVGYYLRSQIFRREMLAFSTMSTRASLNNSMISKLKIRNPPIVIQKAIAHILGSLDDKIELNRQMNETLEAMAQALFKSWFVDFDPVIDNALAAGNAIPDELFERAEQRKAIEKKENSDIQKLFPDEFEFTEEMGWIPRGWAISTLGQESDFSNGYAFKSKELTAAPEDAFHVFKMGHIKQGGGFNYDGTKSYFPIADSKNLERYLLKKGDLLMAMTDMKSSMALLGHTALMPENNKFLVNQRVGRLSVKEDATLNYPYIYIYSNLDTTISELRSRANSGVQVNLSTAEIKATNILVPSKSVHDIFDVKAVSFFEKTFLNDQLNRKLAETRDTLLPKLMSGELRIADTAAMVEEA